MLSSANDTVTEHVDAATQADNAGTTNSTESACTANSTESADNANRTESADSSENAGTADSAEMGKQDQRYACLSQLNQLVGHEKSPVVMTYGAFSLVKSGNGKLLLVWIKTREA